MEGNPSEMDKIPETQKLGKLMGKRVDWDLCVHCSNRIHV